MSLFCRTHSALTFIFRDPKLPDQLVASSLRAELGPTVEGRFQSLDSSSRSGVDCRKLDENYIGTLTEVFNLDADWLETIL